MGNTEARKETRKKERKKKGWKEREGKKQLSG